MINKNGSHGKGDRHGNKDGRYLKTGRKAKKNNMKALSIKEQTIDTAKSILAWIVVTGLAFLYWIVVLLLISLVLLNVWHVTFDSIVQYSVVLTVITSAAYIGRKIYNHRH